ncbi:MAG: carboxymuconolactone decarboxylase family protein [Gammaproteobacteria bacterium]|nr:carboxymuconolactone decarboxylase family protein [Gammaproteobacteria bacterium]
MPLVEPLPADADESVRKLSEFFGGPLGFTPNSVLTMQRRPEIARAFIELNIAVTEPVHIDNQLKRMIGYMASFAAGCRYCQAHLALGASRFGASDEKVAALWQYRTSPLFSDAERAALDFALAAASVPNGVTEEIASELKKHYSDDAIVEILAEVALMGFLNRWNDSMGTVLEAQPAELGETLLQRSGWSSGKHG